MDIHSLNMLTSVCQRRLQIYKYNDKYTKQDIYLKDAILALFCGARK